MNGTAGELCDTAGQSPTCDLDCTPATCGDGTTNAIAGEECDDSGVQTVNCDLDCTLAACGDGTLNSAAGEACDDGNGTNGDGCDNDCTVSGCGDGIGRPERGLRRRQPRKRRRLRRQLHAHGLRRRLSRRPGEACDDGTARRRRVRRELYARDLRRRHGQRHGGRACDDGVGESATAATPTARREAAATAR